MTRRLPILLGALLALALPRPAACASEPRDWRGDARVLAAAVDSLHPRPHRFVSRAAWDSATAVLETQLASARPEQALCGFAHLLAMLRDGHSRLDQLALPAHGRPALTPLPWPGFATFYPLECDVFADGLWVTHATAPHADLLGAHVIAIDGRLTAAAVAALAPLVSADNAMWTLNALPAYLRSPGWLAAAGLAGDPLAPLRLTLLDAQGRRRDAVVAAEPPDTAARWLDADRDERAPLPLTRALPGPFAFADLDARTVFARVRAIVNEPGHERFAGFVARLFAHLDSRAAPRLVLDLRGNGGGDNYLNQPLVHALIARPALDRTGALFVIVDRGTFSAAVSLAADLERETHAVFVGEPTGGAPDSPGDPVDVKLPASGIVARVSTVLWQGSDPRDPRAFIAPDVPAMPAFADWLAHRDPALAALAAWAPPAAAPDVPPNTHWGQRARLKAALPAIAW